MVGFYNYTMILTYAGVASSIMGIGFCIGQRPFAGLVCLMIAGFCDMFDGAVARTLERTEREKKFGIQIDSLADILNFGVLPVAIGYALGLRRWYETLVLVLYVLAALIRLAYFNVTEDELQITKRTKRVAYDGLPVTTAALLIPFICVFRPLMPEHFAYLYLAWLLVLAASFVTKIKIRKPGMKGRIIAGCLGILILVALGIQWTR